MNQPSSFRWKGEPRAARRIDVPEKRQRRLRRRLPRFKLWHWAAVFFAFAATLLIAACVWIWSLDIDKLAIPSSAPTQLLDIDGKAVSEISAVKNIPVSIDRIPMSMRQAIVAVEDKRFYEHTGVDVPGIIRAAFRNASEGAAAEGGSTITQQLAKNVFLSDKKSFSRKLTEAAYAFKIESLYDKDRILEMYLNQIYFGEGQWGIQKAAGRYFGKDTRDLSLAESALLAALPKAPSRYSPFRNKDLALDRRNLVLDLMRKQQFITEEEYNQAKAEPIRLADSKSQENSLAGKYGSFADAVIDEAIERYGFTERQLMAGNLRIYTTLDPVVQEAMEKSFRNDNLFPKSAPDQQVQAGAVIMNPHTGGIRGIVGQRGEHVFRGFNHATQLKRQPGSTFKPIMVYAPALEKGYEPDSMLYDGPLDIDGYRPQDADRTTRGEVSLQDAIVHSYNIPAVWLLNEIGISAGKSFTQKLGIPLSEDDNHLSLALGGLSEGVSPLQMAQAFSVFPSLGKLAPAHTIIKITTADGKLLAESNVQPVEVMSQTDAYTMTSLLGDVVKEGTGANAALDRPTAGKTGTTQLPPIKQFEGITGGVKDVWFVGYTPELTGAVWMGYDVTDRGHYLTTSGGYYPALLFKEMMTLALQGDPVSGFKLPESFRQKLEPEHKKTENRKEEHHDKKDKHKRHDKKHKDDD